MIRAALGIAVAHACLRHARTLGWDRDEMLDVARWLAAEWAPAAARRCL